MSKPSMSGAAPFSKCVSNEIKIRPATVDDMARKAEIMAWYNLNTLGDAAECPKTPDERIDEWRTVTGLGYPYLTAEINGYVVGHTYLRAWHNEPNTAELSLYVDHEYLYRGVGSRLLEKVFDVLARPGQYSHEWLGESQRATEHSINAVIARAHVNPEGRDGGEGLPRFYESMGFEKIARLEKGAKKGGRL